MSGINHTSCQQAFSALGLINQNPNDMTAVHQLERAVAADQCSRSERAQLHDQIAGMVRRADVALQRDLGVTQLTPAVSHLKGLWNADGRNGLTWLQNQVQSDREWIRDTNSSAPLTGLGFVMVLGGCFGTSAVIANPILNAITTRSGLVKGAVDLLSTRWGIRSLVVTLGGCALLWLASEHVGRMLRL